MNSKQTYILLVFEVISVFGENYHHKSASATHQNTSHNSLNFTFPKNFIFAAAGSAYQQEGAWNESGRGESIWDHLAHTQPELMKNGNGDIACDSYHKYEEDVRLLKELGFDVYRLSISWSRILPTGDVTNVNEAGIQYYVKLIDALLKNGIEPMVTIYHWDLPQTLQDIGGWMNPLIADYCEDYADVLFKRLGNKVKWWLTINEPFSIILGYTGKKLAPDLFLDSPADYILGHNILRAHGRIYRLYENKYRSAQKGRISIALNGPYYKQKSDSADDIEAANRAMIFTYDWFAHPIFSDEGDYPKLMREVIDRNSEEEGRTRSRLPTFTPDEIKSIKGSGDFFGLNHYLTRLTSSAKNSSYSSLWDKDRNFVSEMDPTWPESSMDWMRVYPEGIRLLLVWIKKQYNNVPIFITEIGYPDSGQTDDTERILFHQDNLKEVLRAIKLDECNVIGYTVWSLLDNLEWLYGFNKTFGIVRVDFSDPMRRRTLKKSASYFKDLLKTRTLPEMKNN